MAEQSVDKDDAEMVRRSAALQRSKRGTLYLLCPVLPVISSHLILPLDEMKFFQSWPWMR
jgi:hypothetical protein